MVDFAGWSMPVLYTSIVEEHLATRNQAGLFDISHMGRLRFDGPDAAVFLDRLLTRKVIGMAPGRIRYSLMTNDSGGILDDVLVYRLSETSQSGPDTEFHLLVVNASNRDKIKSWISEQLQGADVRMSDLTTQTAMIAVQGPKALALAQPLTPVPLDSLAYYSGLSTRIGSASAIVSRTGYTGEDGVEIIVSGSEALGIWEGLIAAGGRAVGLGARDTLRLEAGMPLYGHELNETRSPFDADLAFAVNLQGREFVGSEALKSLPLYELDRRIGLELSGRRVPRENYPVLLDGHQVGTVTSGTFSPTLQKPIAMAYVRPAASPIGSELQIDIRGSYEPAKVVALPFYSRAR